MVTTSGKCPISVGRSDSRAVGSPATNCVVWAGEELTQSYFPITWSYEERQATSTSQYGFACSCPRCQVPPCVRDTVHPQMWSVRSLTEVASTLYWARAQNYRVICRSRLPGTRMKTLLHLTMQPVGVADVPAACSQLTHRGFRVGCEHSTH